LLIIESCMRLQLTMHHLQQFSKNSFSSRRKADFNGSSRSERSSANLRC
jgi:hypothetical protein